MATYFLCEALCSLQSRLAYWDWLNPDWRQGKTELKVRHKPALALAPTLALTHTLTLTRAWTSRRHGACSCCR